MSVEMERHRRNNTWLPLNHKTCFSQFSGGMKEISVEGCDPSEVPESHSVQMNIWQGEAENTFSIAWPFNYTDNLFTQWKCSSVKGHSQYLASLVQCPLSFVSYIPSFTCQNQFNKWQLILLLEVRRVFALLRSCPSIPAASALSTGLLIVTLHKQLELAHRNTWTSSSFVPRLPMALSWWEVFLFDFLPWCCPSKEAILGGGVFKDIFLLCESNRLSVIRVVRGRSSSPDELVSDRFGWMPSSSSCWQDTGLGGPLVPPPAAPLMHCPHLPYWSPERVAGNSQVLLLLGKELKNGALKQVF